MLKTSRWFQWLAKLFKSTPTERKGSDPLASIKSGSRMSRALMNWIDLRTHVQTQLPADTWVLTKKPTTHIWEKTPSSKRQYYSNQIAKCRGIIKLDPYLWPWTKLNSKWIKDPNVISNTLNLKEVIGTGNNFLSRIPELKKLGSKIDEWGPNETKKLWQRTWSLEWKGHLQNRKNLYQLNI